MSATVVDASALAAVLFHEPEGPLVLEACRGLRLLAPDLLDFELANVAVTRQRRQPADSEWIQKQFEVFLCVDIARLPVDIAAVVSLAAMTQLTAYDAAYLWLAHDQRCGLVTLDRALQAAMRG